MTLTVLVEKGRLEGLLLQIICAEFLRMESENQAFRDSQGRNTTIRTLLNDLMASRDAIISTPLLRLFLAQMLGRDVISILLWNDVDLAGNPNPIPRHKFCVQSIWPVEVEILSRSDRHDISGSIAQSENARTISIRVPSSASNQGVTSLPSPVLDVKIRVKVSVSVLQIASTEIPNPTNRIVSGFIWLEAYPEFSPSINPLLSVFRLRYLRTGTVRPSGSLFDVEEAYRTLSAPNAPPEYRVVAQTIQPFRNELINVFSSLQVLLNDPFRRFRDTLTELQPPAVVPMIANLGVALGLADRDGAERVELRVQMEPPSYFASQVNPTRVAAVVSEWTDFYRTGSHANLESNAVDYVDLAYSDILSFLSPLVARALLHAWPELQAKTRFGSFVSSLDAPSSERVNAAKSWMEIYNSPSGDSPSAVERRRLHQDAMRREFIDVTSYSPGLSAWQRNNLGALFDSMVRQIDTVSQGGVAGPDPEQQDDAKRYFATMLSRYSLPERYSLVQRRRAEQPSLSLAEAENEVDLELYDLRLKAAGFKATPPGEQSRIRSQLVSYGAGGPSDVELLRLIRLGGDAPGFPASVRNSRGYTPGTTFVDDPSDCDYPQDACLPG